MKNYVSYRIDTQRIKDHTVVAGYYLLGQRIEDLNWDYISDHQTLAEAITAAKSLMTGKQILYSPGGYEIKV